MTRYPCGDARGDANLLCDFHWPNENHRFWSPRASPQGYRIQFSLFGQIGKIFHYFDQFLQKDILIFFKITLSCLGSNWSALHELFKYAIHLLFTQFLLLLWPFVYLKWRIPKIAENLDFWNFSKYVKNCPKNNEWWIMKISLMFFQIVSVQNIRFSLPWPKVRPWLGQWKLLIID